MPSHSGTSCLRCSAWSQTHGHAAYSVVDSGSFTFPHACGWSTSLDTRHIRPPATRASSFPVLAVKGTLSPPDCFALPAIHSAGFWLQGRCLLMLQPLNGSLSFRLWEAFSFFRKWHPECFLFAFYFVLKCCQNEFSFKSPSYFGNIVKYQGVSECLWLRHKPIGAQMNVYKNIPSWLRT